MADKITPPPDVSSPEFKQWLFKLRKVIDELSVPVATASFPMSSGNAIDLTDGGDSSLHYQSSDRNRANHTGTQTTDTISDFASAVQALISANQTNTSGGDSVLAAQIFGS